MNLQQNFHRRTSRGSKAIRVGSASFTDANLRVADAAGDLGVTPRDLAANLDLLHPALAVLSDERLARDDFKALYIDSLRLATPLENQSDAAVCEAAAP